MTVRQAVHAARELAGLASEAAWLVRVVTLCRLTGHRPPVAYPTSHGPILSCPRCAATLHYPG